MKKFTKQSNLYLGCLFFQVKKNYKFFLFAFATFWTLKSLCWVCDKLNIFQCRCRTQGYHNPSQWLFILFFNKSKFTLSKGVLHKIRRIKKSGGRRFWYDEKKFKLVWFFAFRIHIIIFRHFRQVCSDTFFLTKKGCFFEIRKLSQILKWTTW